MDEKGNANSIKFLLFLMVILYWNSMSENLLFLIKNISKLTFSGVIYLFPFLLLGIYVLYSFVKILIGYFKKTDFEVNSSFEDLRQRNLEYQANMPINIFGNIKYNKNKLNSTEFLFFGNGKLNLFFLFLFFGFLLYSSDSKEEIIFNLGIIAFALFIFLPLILFMSKSTAKNQLKFDKELKVKKEKGIKLGIMDELTWKSILIILILGTLIVGVIIFLFGVFLYFFA